MVKKEKSKYPHQNTFKYEKVKMRVPKYVSLDGTEMRLKDFGNGHPTYYRDAGCWEVGFKINKDGRLFATSFFEHLNGIELIPISRQKWVKANKDYA